MMNGLDCEIWFQSLKHDYQSFNLYRGYSSTMYLPLDLALDPIPTVCTLQTVLGVIT